MKNALQFLFVAFWLFASCMPIIFTARYMEKVDVLILIFGYINALFLGVFMAVIGFAPIFPDTCYHLTHYWLAAVDIPVASDNPVH
ncbi:hypothetical protein ACRW0Z_23150, partial [Escherichia coli]